MEELKNKRLFGAICSVHRMLVRRSDVYLAECGISSVQLHTLVFLHISMNKGNSVCQRDIEREIGLRPSSVSSMLTNLERAELISRVPSEGDARSKCIVLRPKGLELCKKNKQLMDTCDRQVSAALTEEEQEQLKNLLSKVQKSLESL